MLLVRETTNWNGEVGDAPVGRDEWERDLARAMVQLAGAYRFLDQTTNEISVDVSALFELACGSLCRSIQLFDELTQAIWPL
jgi:hypothetical protein